MEILVNFVLDLLDIVLQKSKSARTQIIADILVVAAVLLAVGCVIWACVGRK